MLLTDDQLERYGRQLILDEVGVEGQKRLLEARVAVVGAGGLGSPVALYLAAAGVGTIGLIDGDCVDASNLHRQILHGYADVGRPKTLSGRERLEGQNPDVTVVEHREPLTAANALSVLAGYDLVVNGSDNFPTRYLVNDACVLLGKPLVDASILKWEGQATVFLPGQGCYRCLYPSPPPPGTVPSCAEGGIMGALAGHMGTLQALEALKVLLGAGEPLVSRLVLFDALRGRYRVLRFRRNPACPVCGDHPTITQLIDYEAFCGVPLPTASTAVAAVAAAPAVATAGPTPAATRAAAAAAGTPPSRAGGESDADATYPFEPGGPVDVTAPVAARFLDDPSVQWIDVRTSEEVAKGMIPGATWIPMEEVAARSHEIDRDRPAVFVCRSGQRSGKVARMLRAAGFDRSFNLAGGMIAWTNHQLPVRQ